ncbi:hypothetical protein [Vibrio splendidus]|uniref:hypothetical protein n=1 Tax=Vibrio splendidus TaxID=29497 RepID=UPI000D39F517|nr:hypothetical protein [Vibrio splendidus]PTP92472.1 hypothetical protein CWO03_02300 [Vibrio splendidus]
MNNKIALSIAITSVISLNSAMAFADAPAEPPVEAKQSSGHGGKCGLMAEGMSPSKERILMANSKVRGGVCGQ